MIRELLEALPEEHDDIKHLVCAVHYEFVNEWLIGQCQFWDECFQEHNDERRDYTLIRAVAGFDPDKLPEHYDILHDEVQALYEEVCGE